MQLELKKIEMNYDATSIEQKYVKLLSQWRNLPIAQGKPNQPDVAPSPDQTIAEPAMITLERWKLQFDRLRQEQMSMMENGDWYLGRTDLLSVIGRARREVDHCAILAWLLDPQSPNGLGALFLSRFLARCFPRDLIDPKAIASARLRCEECRDNSRADLIIRTDRLTVVVEAKVDHTERDEQCDDLYADYQGEPGACFVFLTPDGRSPQTASGDAKAQFRCLSFPAVAHALREATFQAGLRLPSHPAWPTIMCYLQTLDGEFS